jgi:hypothetical protein
MLIIIGSVSNGLRISLEKKLLKGQVGFIEELCKLLKYE